MSNTTVSSRAPPPNFDDEDAQMPDIISPKRHSLTIPTQVRPIVPPATKAPAASKALAASKVPAVPKTTNTQPPQSAATTTAATTAAPKVAAPMAASATTKSGDDEPPGLNEPDIRGSISFSPADLKAFLNWIPEAAIRISSNGHVEICTSDREGAEFAAVEFTPEKRKGFKVDSGLRRHGFSIPKRLSSVITKLVKQHLSGEVISLAVNPIPNNAKSIQLGFVGEEWSSEAKYVSGSKGQQPNVTNGLQKAPFVKVSTLALSTMLSQLSQLGGAVDVSIEERNVVLTVEGTTIRVPATGFDARGAKSAAAKGIPLLRLIKGLKVGVYVNDPECMVYCGSEIPGVVVVFRGPDIGAHFLLKEPKKKH